MSTVALHAELINKPYIHNIVKVIYSKYNKDNEI